MTNSPSQTLPRLALLTGSLAGCMVGEPSNGDVDELDDEQEAAFWESNGDAIADIESQDSGTEFVTQASSPAANACKYAVKASWVLDCVTPRGKDTCKPKKIAKAWNNCDKGYMDVHRYWNGDYHRETLVEPGQYGRKEQTFRFLTVALNSKIRRLNRCYLGFERTLYLPLQVPDFPTVAANCQGGSFLHSLGYSRRSYGKNVRPVYRCRQGNDSFMSWDPACEGQIVESMIGYAQDGNKLTLDIQPRFVTRPASGSVPVIYKFIVRGGEPDEDTGIVSTKSPTGKTRVALDPLTNKDSWDRNVFTSPWTYTYTFPWTLSANDKPGQYVYEVEDLAGRKATVTLNVQ